MARRRRKKKTVPARLEATGAEPKATELDGQGVSPPELKQPRSGLPVWLAPVLPYLGLSEHGGLMRRKAASSRPRGGLLDLLEPLLGALIFTLVLREFALAAYVIPTGSMAPTLFGEHVIITCPECGEQYPVGSPFGNPEEASPPMFSGHCPSCRVPLSAVSYGGEDLPFPCPSCGVEIRTGDLGERRHNSDFRPICPSCQTPTKTVVARLRPFTGDAYGGGPIDMLRDTFLGSSVGGNKIVVNKTVYKWRDPRRWEVVVFQYPNDTYITYIKRLVGLPGELIGIRNGDLTVDGEVVPRPPDVQEAIWLDVATRARFRRGARPWVADDRGFSPHGQGFSIHTRGRGAAEASTLRFTSQIRAYCSYNADRTTPLTPIGDEPSWNISPLAPAPTADLRLALSLLPADSSGPTDGGLRLEISEELFLPAALDAGGQPEPYKKYFYAAEIPVGRGGPWRLVQNDAVLAEVEQPALDSSLAHDLVFWNANDELVLKLDDEIVLRARYKTSADGVCGASALAIQAWGFDGAIDDPEIKRDIQYTSSGRLPSEPLGADEFFVMGDNSPNSLDSRWWGPFQRKYLIGKALAVFLPAHPWDWQVRWIH